MCEYAGEHALTKKLTSKQYYTCRRSQDCNHDLYASNFTDIIIYTSLRYAKIVCRRLTLAAELTMYVIHCIIIV